jgi:hypothetical protein
MKNVHVTSRFSPVHLVGAQQLDPDCPPTIQKEAENEHD